MMDWIVGFTALFYVILAPYNKVEESFNLQASHDIMYHGTNLQEYDHFDYPGVVPRTFIGPLLVSSIAWPFVLVIRIFGFSKLYSQYVVRIILGMFVFLAWRHLRKRVENKFGSSLSLWFSLITATQFHFLYYMSRTLPNTYALIFALLAFSFWMEQRHGLMICCCGIAVIIFRAELCLVLGPIIIYDLYQRHLELLTFLKYAIPAGLGCLLATVFIDSIFWGRLLWPEGEVFWFNTYLNQSSQWGVYPFLWYWYSALPRALGVSYLFVPVGIAIDPRVRIVSGPALLFVALYSFLPHKELRFILYALPFYNLAAARACQYLWDSRAKSTQRQLLAVGCGLHLFGNLALTFLLASVSAWNYPGGEAMELLHNTVDVSQSVHIHIGNLAAQTGVSRFTHLHDHWRYNKTEHLKAGSVEIRSFTHLLVEAKSKYAYNLKHYTQTHEILGSVESFSHLSFNYNSFPPIKFRVKPAIYLLRNVDTSDVDWSFLPDYAQNTEFEVLEQRMRKENVNTIPSISEGLKKASKGDTNVSPDSTKYPNDPGEDIENWDTLKDNTSKSYSKDRTIDYTATITEEKHTIKQQHNSSNGNGIKIKKSKLGNKKDNR